MTLELLNWPAPAATSHVLNLEPEDLVALMEAAAMAESARRHRLDSGEADTGSGGDEGERKRMTTDLAKAAKDQGIKCFLISFVDLLGGLRASSCPPPPSARCRKPAPASWRASPPGST